MGAPAVRTTTSHHAHEPQSTKELLAVSLGALGVVCGDIGTSPLYAINECIKEVSEKGERAIQPEDVLGILSCVFWALTLIICIKYLVFVLRADNKGEGGILSLAALVVGPD